VKKVLVYLSLLVPASLLSTKYLFDRIELLPDDPENCDQDWMVIAGILNTVELQVQCAKCASYSKVPNPTKEEWDACAGAVENPNPWEDKTPVRQQNDE
jgi:hypothetical protein